MPELPEVETVRRTLLPHLKNRTITAVNIRNAQVIASPEPQTFTSALVGQTVTDFARRGKFLRLMFTSGDVLTVHLRMTGCLTVEKSAAPYEKHTHLILALNDGSELRYEDTRRFGRFWYAAKNDRDQSGMDKLGVDPFDAKAVFKALNEKRKTVKRSVKQTLLDQSIIAGIGNIYSDEICFCATIHPERAFCTLSEDETKRLANAVTERLLYFTAKNEISFDDYIKSRGKEYRNAPYLQVYGKQGQPCNVCKTAIERKTIGGRSSYYCPHCQNNE